MVNRHDALPPAMNVMGRKMIETSASILIDSLVSYAIILKIYE